MCHLTPQSHQCPLKKEITSANSDIVSPSFAHIATIYYLFISFHSYPMVYTDIDINTLESMGYNNKAYIQLFSFDVLIH